VLFSLTREVGTSLVLDDCPMKKTLGYYAQVLVDVDLLSFLPTLLVEHLSFAFVAEVKYERFLLFCFS